MDKILVTGKNGQLGQCIKKADKKLGSYQFLFTSSSELDITDDIAIEDYFAQNHPKYCINTAAYTAVDLAETDRKKAFDVNAEGVRNLARVCAAYGTLLIHISTDYVFDGNTDFPYHEDDWTNPAGVYGLSKVQGEQNALEENERTIILRTSWLYSEFGNNFVKTMLRLFKNRKELSVVSDQFGQPTNANDLAETILKIIEFPIKKYGIYHFSNFGETTWCDFAKEIASLEFASTKIKPIKTKDYPTVARRPKRSTFCLDKIERDYKIQPKDWRESLRKCLMDFDNEL